MQDAEAGSSRQALPRLGRGPPRNITGGMEMLWPYMQPAAAGEPSLGSTSEQGMMSEAVPATLPLSS